MSSNKEFLPYGAQTVEEDDIRSVVEVLRGPYLTTGPAVDRFERSLATTVGAGGAVAVSSGTAALHAACFAAGVSDGDEVIVPAISFLATANCARYLGAEPVFADVDPDTGLLLAGEIERLRNERTRVIVPVHLNGALADVSAARASADRAGAVVIEDAAHSLHTTRPAPGLAEHGRCRSERGSMAVYSFLRQTWLLIQLFQQLYRI